MFSHLKLQQIKCGFNSSGSVLLHIQFEIIYTVGKITIEHQYLKVLRELAGFTHHEMLLV